MGPPPSLAAAPPAKPPGPGIIPVHEASTNPSSCTGPADASAKAFEPVMVILNPVASDSPATEKMPTPGPPVLRDDAEADAVDDAHPGGAHQHRRPADRARVGVDGDVRVDVDDA